MLGKSTVIDSKNIEISLSDRSDVRIERSYYEHLKSLERRHQIVVVMKPLIYQLLAAEAASNSLLVAKLEEQLTIERNYLVKISRTVMFTLDPTNTGE